MSRIVSSVSIPNLLKTVGWTTHSFIRNAARQPIKVLKEDEVNERYRATSGNYNPYKDPNRRLENLKERNDLKVILPSGFPTYTKMGEDDTTLSQFAMNTSCPKKRQKSGLIMLEGKRLITEALKSKLNPKAIFFSRLSDVANFPFQAHTFIFQKISYEKIQRWSKLVTPPGVIGFFRMPSEKISVQTSLPLSLICDNVRDPGNLGCIIRTAAAVGCREVLLVKGCVDVWDSKVLRSSAGSHFHIVVQHGLSWEDVQQKMKEESSLYIADNSMVIEDDLYTSVVTPGTVNPASIKDLPIIPYYNEDFSNATDLFLFVGGETEGFSKEVVMLEKSHKVTRLHIPMKGQVESLNVGAAVGILTYEIRRQLEKASASLEESSGLSAMCDVNLS